MTEAERIELRMATSRIEELEDELQQQRAELLGAIDAFTTIIKGLESKLEKHRHEYGKEKLFVSGQPVTETPIFGMK